MGIIKEIRIEVPKKRKEKCVTRRDKIYKTLKNLFPKKPQGAEN